MMTATKHVKIHAKLDKAQDNIARAIGKIQAVHVTTSGIDAEILARAIEYLKQSDSEIRDVRFGN